MEIHRNEVELHMKKTILFITVLAMLFACACGGGAEPAETDAPEVTVEPAAPSILPAPEPTEEPTPEPAPELTPEPTPEPIVSPLTGEEIDSEYITRPFAVMLNNISVALPQCSVSEAAIMYEILAEGGITRFMAIFPDMEGVGAIGSMRSLRPYYLSTALSYDAIVVHAGGSDQAYSDVETKGADNIDGVRGYYGGEIFYRDPSRTSAGYEHSLFTTGELVTKAVEMLEYRTELEQGFDFGLSFTRQSVPENWNAAGEIVVNYGVKTSTFTYDPASDSYTMVQYNQKFIDGSTGEAVSFANLIVISADTVTLDDYGRLGITLTGSGSGSIYRNGKTADITWSRAAEGEPFVYTLADGSQAELGVGRTFICVIPTGTGSVTAS